MARPRGVPPQSQIRRLRPSFDTKGVRLNLQNAQGKKDGCYGVAFVECGGGITELPAPCSQVL
jgi:hypothetical protein